MTAAVDVVGLRELARRYEDTMGLTREGAIRRVHTMHDALLDAADALEAATAREAALVAQVEALWDALIAEREENLWNAYHTGSERDGRWTHMFMSDGEALAQACGFDPTARDYPADAIKAAIPKAARAALEAKP